MRSWLVVLIALLLSAGCSKNIRPSTELPNIVMEDLYGRWYIQANVPYFAEKGKVGSYVEYHPRDDGRIHDWYFFRREALSAPLEKWTGVAENLDTVSNAQWRAQFIWPLWSRFDIAYANAQKDQLVVTSADRKLCWIYTRSQQLSDSDRERLLERATALNCPTEKMIKIPQLSSPPD